MDLEKNFLTAPRNITLIAAKTENSVIGLQGAQAMLWHLTGDFKHFKVVTDGQTIVMGSNTFESIFNRKNKQGEMLHTLLPNRKHIVLTTQFDYIERFNTKYSVRLPIGQNLQIIHDYHTILEQYPEDLYIIGGSQIYNLFMPYATRLEITTLQVSIPLSDFTVVFPDINLNIWNRNAVTEQGVHKEFTRIFNGTEWKSKEVVYSFESYTLKNNI